MPPNEICPPAGNQGAGSDGISADASIPTAADLPSYALITRRPSTGKHYIRLSLAAVETSIREARRQGESVEVWLVKIVPVARLTDPVADLGGEFR
jgi:hypothetical protein